MKSIFASKTMWFNAVAIVALYIQAHSALLPQLGLSTDVVATIIGAVNILLRFVTKTAVTVTGA
jgi:hypothetical protein